MSVFKCKMCGGTLNAAAGKNVCQCEYCGTLQTLPHTRDDIIANLFNRANALRIKSDFDKALEVYESIVEKTPDDPEAYWGMVLCKFGIEYVDDPATGNKVPTCHRTLLESVLTDVDYASALQYAEPQSRELYEYEAAEIDRLQKEIINIVRSEEPFDVFICYKEKDENGKRTKDSVIANDIYYQLTQEGFKTFYAAITLEDKLGKEYEPYIFAALQTAKVMLVIGTQPEYFNAPWVKNEWSRYLKIIKADRNKLLIPCYRDMDAYDLPEEFSHLQAQDMSKIGFMNDVIRGIKKLVSADNNISERIAVPKRRASSFDEDKMLKRINIFLSDHDFESAEEYCETILDNDPECAQAYLAKFLAEYSCSQPSEIYSEKNIDFFANKYIQGFGTHIDDNELFTTRMGYILGNNMKNALIFSKGSEHTEIAHINDGIIIMVRNAIGQIEKQQLDYEYRVASSALEQHKEEERAIKKKKRKKKLFLIAFLCFILMLIFAGSDSSSGAGFSMILFFILLIMGFLA